MKTTLPHQSDRLFLSDGGQETTLVFHDGIDLPCFAAYPLLRTESGRAWFRAYYGRYLDIAQRLGAGFVLESPTWRANPDWAAKLGDSAEALARVNRDAIGLMHAIREARETPELPIVVSGCIGPRGDGYVADHAMSPEEAAAYHGPQVRLYRDAGADVVTAMTMVSLTEALGVARAAAEGDVPCVISFTTETDGRMPDGHALREAIETVDAQAGRPPAYYMINCAHPTHFADQFEAGAAWVGRIGGVRANASCRSHAELDAATELDPGDPESLGADYRALRERLPNLKVLGGCCGTDHRHLEAIGTQCVEAFA